MEDIFYIDGEKEEELNENILESGRLSQKRFRFMLVLQNENMLEANVETSILVYNMGKYFILISKLDKDYKAFILYFLDSTKNAATDC